VRDRRLHVGEPWNQQAVSLGIGRIAVAVSHLESDAGEGAGTTEAWARSNPDLVALIGR
jgi:ABC-type nitrate/sulfonate/bicarbonate transport system substrate-binding protein